MNALAESILAVPANERPREDRAKRRRHLLEAALLAQPVRDTPVFQPYAGSGFRRAVRAREESGRLDAA